LGAFIFVVSHPFYTKREKDGAPGTLRLEQIRHQDLCIPTLAQEQKRGKDEAPFSCWVESAGVALLGERH
jgi:hypothetical protein